MDLLPYLFFCVWVILCSIMSSRSSMFQDVSEFLFFLGLNSILLYGFFFKKIFIFNWRMIALQYYIGFCHMSIWITHRYTYAPSLFYLPPHPTPLGCYRAWVWVSWVTQQISTGYFTHDSVYVSMLFSPFVLPSPSSPDTRPQFLYPSICWWVFELFAPFGILWTMLL